PLEAMPLNRTVLLPESDTKTEPLLEMAIPSGALNRAAEPVPFVLPLARASPATVVTAQFVPTGATLRIVALPESTTYKFPKGSSASPCGRKKRATVFDPSAVPQTPEYPAI